MNICELTTEILDTMKVFYEDKAFITRYKQITYGNLVETILSSKNTRSISMNLGISERTLERHLSKAIPELPKGVSWRDYLLNKINGIDIEETKECSCCKQIKDINLFYNNVKRNKCKSCIAEEHSIYYYKNKSKFRYYDANRRAVKLSATPKWANLDEIKEFYSKCPEGCHVDHYYPLVSKIVCGLHVTENLQYLSVTDNLSKGNSMP